MNKLLLTLIIASALTQNTHAALPSLEKSFHRLKIHTTKALKRTPQQIPCLQFSTSNKSKKFNVKNLSTTQKRLIYWGIGGTFGYLLGKKADEKYNDIQETKALSQFFDRDVFQFAVAFDRYKNYHDAIPNRLRRHEKNKKWFSDDCIDHLSDNDIEAMQTFLNTIEYQQEPLETTKQEAITAFEPITFAALAGFMRNKVVRLLQQDNEMNLSHYEIIDQVAKELKNLFLLRSICIKDALKIKDCQSVDDVNALSKNANDEQKLAMGFLFTRDETRLKICKQFIKNEIWLNKELSVYNPLKKYQENCKMRSAIVGKLSYK